MLLAEPLRQLDLMSLTRLVSSHQHQSTVVKEQLVAVLYRQSQDPVRSVSGERIAPNRSYRIATLAFIEVDCACKIILTVRLFSPARNRHNLYDI